MKVYFKNHLRNFDRYRRQKMYSLESLLYRLIKNDSILEKQLLPKKDVKCVLIMRNNKRIGNILFLITFARQTRLAYPDAKVDLMLTMPSQGTYIEGLGLDNIFYSHLSFKGIFKWLGLIKKLNTVKYDLILAPNCCASDSITTAMIASKNKVSAFNERRVWAFPHAQHVTSSREHAAHSSLAILESLGHQLCYPLNHNLPFSEDEIEQGANLSRVYKTEEDTVDMVFFSGARGVKLLSEEVWETLLLKFESGTDKKINWIEVLSPDIKEPLRDNIKTFATSNMRVLGTFLKTFDAFICCDTGPMHLADAAAVKCIGLYTHTSPNTFGLLGDECVHITDVDNFNAGEIMI